MSLKYYIIGCALVGDYTDLLRSVRTMCRRYYEAGVQHGVRDQAMDWREFDEWWGPIEYPTQDE